MANKKVDTVTEVTQVKDAAGNVITSNAATIVYPTDIWGLTSDVKNSIKYLAARVCGSEDKYKLAKETLAICEQYLDARYKDDRARGGNV